MPWKNLEECYCGVARMRKENCIGWTGLRKLQIKKDGDLGIVTLKAQKIDYLQNGGGD